VVDRALATAIFFVARWASHGLLEGEGAGKTEVAKTLARLLNTTFDLAVRYEGLDVLDGKMRNYPRQMLFARNWKVWNKSRA